MMIESYPLVAVSSVVFVWLLHRARVRLRLSRAKHPSLRGHSKWSRRVARWIPFFEYDTKRFFCTDGAPSDVEKRRRTGFERLKQTLLAQSPNSIKFTDSLVDSISDVRFTNAYRVPFPYRNFVRKNLKIGQVVEESAGTRIRDMDGVWRYDLSGSYGVNVFGYEFYKDCLEKGFEKVRNLGPVLGPYHPLIRENVEMLKSVSGLDEVSFHMSGTEAVMQAVRLARYHTGRSHLVRLCGAYHGWWDGVQPGIGNRRRVDDVYTLRDMDNRTLQILDTRKDIACVLINPLQAFHPNSDAASDATLVNSDRSTGFDREAYSAWLQAIREVCSRRSIVLIFDEVFTGFRLAYRGAQEYFNVCADLVTYGKTVGGGLPVGVVCGKHELMKRFRDDQPVNFSFARGTFNSHPCVMATMNEFLDRVQKSEYQQIYRESEALWNHRVRQLNRRFEATDLPIRVANICSIWTILFTHPARYNWMLQYYFRARGVALSWMGSGRLILSNDFSEDDLTRVMNCIVAAATDMQRDGWWWENPELTDKSIKRQMLWAMVAARIPLVEKLYPESPQFGFRQKSYDEVSKT